MIVAVLVLVSEGEMVSEGVLVNAVGVSVINGVDDTVEIGVEVGIDWNLALIIGIKATVIVATAVMTGPTIAGFAIQLLNPLMGGFVSEPIFPLLSFSTLEEFPSVSIASPPLASMIFMNGKMIVRFSLNSNTLEFVSGLAQSRTFSRPGDQFFKLPGWRGPSTRLPVR